MLELERCRMRKSPKTLARCGTIMARYVFIQPNLLMIANWGTTYIIPGIMSDARKNAKSLSRPKNSFFAKT